MSEALLFAEHWENLENLLSTKIVLNVRNNFCTQHALPRFELGIFMYWTCSSMNNLSSYCGLVDTKIRASDKDLPVLQCKVIKHLLVKLHKLKIRNANLQSLRPQCASHTFLTKQFEISIKYNKKFKTR